MLFSLLWLNEYIFYKFCMKIRMYVLAFYTGNLLTLYNFINTITIRLWICEAYFSNFFRIGKNWPFSMSKKSEAKFFLFWFLEINCDWHFSRLWRLRRTNLFLSILHPPFRTKRNGFWSGRGRSEGWTEHSKKHKSGRKVRMIWGMHWRELATQKRLLRRGEKKVLSEWKMVELSQRWKVENKGWLAGLPLVFCKTFKLRAGGFAKCV